MMKHIRSLVISAAVALLTGAMINAGEVVHHETFGEGIQGWEIYRGGDEAAALSHTDEAAYDGGRSLKIDTRGTMTLEGAGKTFPVEPGNRYMVTLKARGTGKVMLCATGPGGWLYGRHTDLTDEWQELKISIFVKGSSLTPTILTIGGAQEVAFYLDDLKITRMEPPDVFDVEVEPVRFEAQDYPGNAKIVEDVSASGGAYSEGKRWFVLGRNMPFPVSSRPVYIYMRLWLEDNENHSILLINSLPFQGGERVDNLRLPAAGEWVWVKAGPYTTGRFVDGFTIGNSGSNPDALARFDCAVVTTDGDLDEADLDNVR